MKKAHSINQIILLTFMMMVMGAVASFAQGQDDSAATEMNQVEMRHQIRAYIDEHPGMDEPMREHMRNNLEGCYRHGMAVEEIQALFPVDEMHGTDQVEHMLSMQDHVLSMVDNDLPMGPMMEKIMEGQMKNVPANRMEHVLEQTGNNIRNSHHMMMDAIEGGVQAPPTSARMHQANSDLAHCLWDGLTEGDMEQIRERSMDRAHDGGCTTDEFVAACQVATRFVHGGMGHDQGVHMAGEAMHNGYSAADMRTMGLMMMSGSGMENHHAEMMVHMLGWIEEGMSMDEMTHYMMEGGWMGPADMMGAGGTGHMDNMGMSGPGHDGGMGGDHGHGGMGGGDDGHGDGGHDGGGM